MRKWNYRQIAAMLASGDYQTFEGNTMRGMWITRNYGAGVNPVFRVWSYNTVIGEYDPTVGWQLNLTKYSVTTSKHQGYLSRAVGA